VEALALWEERERRRLKIIAMMTRPTPPSRAVKGQEFTKESTPTLVEEAKRRLRPRIALEVVHGPAITLV